jgi:serine/threonine protein kinase
VNERDAGEPDWLRLRDLFEELVDLTVAERQVELARAELSAPLRSRLERLLAADHHATPFLQPGQPIELPSEATDDDRLPDAAASLPRRLGRYELHAVLGKGGMGEVYLARDLVLERDVALKILAPALLADTQWLQRFRSEARTAGGLNHPNVITVHDVGETDGAHFLVTEFVRGETLRQRLDGGRLPLAQVLDLGRQIASALVAAHAAGVVHRDVKPENVMLREDGLVKVVDFGLAKATPAILTTTPGQSTQQGVLLGTMRYMSPEQARGGDVDARADVFGLGALLYEMIAGEPAFAGESALDVLVALLDRGATPLLERAPGTPAALAAVVDGALQQDRARRTPSAKVLLAQLEALRGEPGLGGLPAAVADAVPEVHYARSGDVNIAYQVCGSGPLDLVFVMGWISHLEWFWREPSFARFLRQLGTFARVILFDKRGTGLSDRVANDRLPTLEQRMDDVRAVLDEIGSKSAVLCGISEGGPMCALFAATCPERTRGLVMIGSYARRLRGDGYPWGSTPEARERFCDEILRHWGGPVGIAERAPSKAADPAFREWWAAYLRHGASPSAAVALTRMNAEIDVRPILATIRVPTLVVHRVGDRCLGIEEGRYLASRIPGARLVELPGDDHLPFVGDQDAVCAPIAEFCAALPRATGKVPALATVLAVQLVPATQTDAVAAGQGEARFRALALRETGIGEGRSLTTGGGRLVGTFEGPARAVQVARDLLALAERMQQRAVVVVHVGACEVLADGAIGPAIDDALAVLRQAPPEQVLVTEPVRALVAGAGLEFTATAARSTASGTIATFTLKR